MNDETKCHTPFCRKDCPVVHHDLIKALCIERNRRETSSRFSSKSHVLLRQCVQLYEQNGWDRNSAVPDSLPDLRHPLLYLTCAFGKHRVLETLVKLDFNPAVVTTDGANGLHALVDHFYRVGNMKQCGGFMAIDKRLEVFENVVCILCSRDPNIFSTRENIHGRTPLHMAAESVVCTSRHARVDGRCDPLKRTRYFQRCLEVMLGHILELRSNSLLTDFQVKNTVSSQDNEGDTILHILAKSRTLPGWESIQYLLKNFTDSEFSEIKNKDSKTAFDILSQFNGFMAKRLFYPSDVEEKMEEDVNGCSSPTNCDPSLSLEASDLTRIAKSPPCTNDITVQAVWSEAPQAAGFPSKGMQKVTPVRSLESVVLSLHNTAKSPATSALKTLTRSPSSTQNELSVLLPNASLVNGKSKDLVGLELGSEFGEENTTGFVDSEKISLGSGEVPTEISGNVQEDFESRRFSGDEPYPVFLPNFSQSEVECRESEVAKQEVGETYSSCCLPSLFQSNLERENSVGTSPSTPDSWMPGSESEATASSSTPCVTSLAGSSLQSPSHEHLDSTTTRKQNCQVTADSAEDKRPVGNASSSGDSAFFDFLLTQGNDFNPTMKLQIVELIKGEFGKKMSGFNREMFKMETEKKKLEAEIQNSKLNLQQKEEERRRLFAEIEKLQRNIVQATEKHKELSEKCMKLKEDSEVVKRKISSCEEVEKELFGTPAKMQKLLDSKY